jgi:hypothetical protein
VQAPRPLSRSSAGQSIIEPLVAEIRALQASMATAGGADPAKVAKMEALGKQVGSVAPGDHWLFSSGPAWVSLCTATAAGCCNFPTLLCCTSM